MWGIVGIVWWLYMYVCPCMGEWVALWGFLLGVHGARDAGPTEHAHWGGSQLAASPYWGLLWCLIVYMV